MAWNAIDEEGEISGLDATRSTTLFVTVMMKAFTRNAMDSSGWEALTGTSYVSTLDQPLTIC
jgi:hypothetical protein